MLKKQKEIQKRSIKIQDSIKNIKTKLKDKTFQTKAQELEELKDEIVKRESARKFVDYAIAGSVFCFGFIGFMLHGSTTSLQEFFQDNDIAKHSGVIEGAAITLGGFFLFARTLLSKSLIS